jgi:hypothetical protein
MFDDQDVARKAATLPEDSRELVEVERGQFGFAGTEENQAPICEESHGSISSYQHLGDGCLQVEAPSAKRQGIFHDRVDLNGIFRNARFSRRADPGFIRIHTGIAVSTT